MTDSHGLRMALFAADYRLNRVGHVDAAKPVGDVLRLERPAARWTKGLKQLEGTADSEGMTIRRMTFKSLVAASATTAILAAGAAPAAHAGKVKVTDTTTDTTTDTKISGGGRKVG